MPLTWETQYLITAVRISFVSRELGEWMLGRGAERGRRVQGKGWSWCQWSFSSGQTLCGVVLWRSAYQKGPTQGVWPGYPVLPEDWGGSERAVLQPILTEDLLPSETASSALLDGTLG